MPRYREKPVEITAVQFDGSDYSAGQIVGWVGAPIDGQSAYLVKRGYEHPMRNGREFDRSNGHILDDAPPYLVIPTSEGDHRADIDDYVIQGVQGEFYPCKPDIFTETYEAVDS